MALFSGIGERAPQGPLGKKIISNLETRSFYKEVTQKGGR